VDAALLYLLMSAGYHAFIVRIFSFSSAITLLYFLNRKITFHHIRTARSFSFSILRHYSVHGLGGLLNYSVFVLILVSAGYSGNSVRNSPFLPLFAVWAGGAAGITFNFFAARKWVWDR